MTMMMMMIFIYCNWVSTRWQWSANLYRNSKETVKKGKTVDKTKTQNTKQKYEQNTNIKLVLKSINQVIRR